MLDPMCLHLSMELALRSSFFELRISNRHLLRPNVFVLLSTFEYRASRIELRLIRASRIVHRTSQLTANSVSDTML